LYVIYILHIYLTHYNACIHTHGRFDLHFEYFVGGLCRFYIFLQIFWTFYIVDKDHDFATWSSVIIYGLIKIYWHHWCDNHEKELLEVRIGSNENRGGVGFEHL
jgi:hypothetical protein